MIFDAKLFSPGIPRVRLAPPILLLLLATVAAGQQPGPAAPLLKRTTTKTDRRDLGYGGRVTIVGGPAGSITVEAWNQSSVEITAEIELQAPTEEDLAQLALLNTFVVDEQMNSIGILTTSTQDKAFMKKNAKNFPKRLLNLPWSIDYHLRVPQLCDLDINAGKGNFSLTGVEGAVTFKSQEGDANLNMSGGDVVVAVGTGNVTLNIASRGWRGRGIDIQVATGKLSINLPPAFNAYINADVLRTGQIENHYAALKPLPRTTATPKSIAGRVGTGGATLNFKVGDGSLLISEAPKPN